MNWFFPTESSNGLLLLHNPFLLTFKTTFYYRAGSSSVVERLPSNVRPQDPIPSTTPPKITFIKFKSWWTYGSQSQVSIRIPWGNLEVTGAGPSLAKILVKFLWGEPGFKWPVWQTSLISSIWGWRMLFKCLGSDLHIRAHVQMPLEEAKRGRWPTVLALGVRQEQSKAGGQCTLLKLSQYTCNVYKHIHTFYIYTCNVYKHTYTF